MNRNDFRSFSIHLFYVLNTLSYINVVCSYATPIPLPYYYSYVTIYACITGTTSHGYILCIFVLLFI